MAYTFSSAKMRSQITFAILAAHVWRNGRNVVLPTLSTIILTCAIASNLKPCSKFLPKRAVFRLRIVLTKYFIKHLQSWQDI